MENGMNRAIDIELTRAACGGDCERILALLAAGADVHVNEDGPLQVAATWGNTEAVRVLLNAGANVHTENEAPLRGAVANGHRDTVEVLLKAGANPLACDFETFQHARLRGNDDMEEFIAAKLERRPPPPPTPPSSPPTPSP